MFQHNILTNMQMGAWLIPWNKLLEENKKEDRTWK
jgi:hypothetical protein